MRNKTILAGMTAVLCLLAFSASFAQNAPGRPGPRGTGERLAGFLDLTPDQQAKFDEIRKARQEEAKAFREEMAKLRPQLREVMKDPKADQNKIDGLIDQMSQARAAHMKSVLRGVRDMEKILTPEQLEKFRRARTRMGRGRWFGPGFGPGLGRGFGLRRGMRPGWPLRPFRGFGWDFDGWL